MCGEKDLFKCIIYVIYQFFFDSFLYLVNKFFFYVIFIDIAVPIQNVITRV